MIFGEPRILMFGNCFVSMYQFCLSYLPHDRIINVSIRVFPILVLDLAELDELD